MLFAFTSSRKNWWELVMKAESMYMKVNGKVSIITLFRNIKGLGSMRKLDENFLPIPCI